MRLLEWGLEGGGGNLQGKYKCQPPERIVNVHFPKVGSSLFISQTNGRKIKVKQSFGFEPEYRYVSSDLYPIVFEVPEQNGEDGMWKMVLECLEWKIEHWIFRLF